MIRCAVAGFGKNQAYFDRLVSASRIGENFRQQENPPKIIPANFPRRENSQTGPGACWGGSYFLQPWIKILNAYSLSSAKKCVLEINSMA